jgi:hypothetical protein
MAAALTLGTMAAPASAGSSGWESILGGHIRTKATATKIARQARAKGFKVYVQKITATNWEVEIFNGGRSKSQALAVCARAKKAGLAHCSVEQEFHGNGWS